jgi:sugar lactone lactonase YvrE
MRSHVRFAPVVLFLGLVAASMSVACSSETGGAGACDATGTGTLVVNVVGLPTGLDAKVSVSGPTGAAQPVTATKTFTGTAAGTYAVTADKVVAPDPIVRTVYSATISSTTTCVANGTTQTVTVTYAPIATSNKIWVATSNASDGRNSVGIASAGLAATGSPAASAAVAAPTGRHVVFDRDGNYWSNGGTVSDPMIVRVPAASFATSGSAQPDRKIDIKGLEFCNGSVALAFDKSGALWYGASCKKALFKLGPDQLQASGAVTAALQIALPGEVQGLAFDKNGNLWVGTGSSALRFDAATLSSASATPAATFTVKTAVAGGSDLHPGWLAFDGSGNLWSNDFGGNVVFQIPAAEQGATGANTLVPPAFVTLQVGALLGGMAFDEGGGLWITYSQGKFIRLTPALLGVTTNAGNPTVPERIVSSPQVAYAEDLAFYPAPAALPLYSALP